MRVRNKEIRKNRKREEENRKAHIKEIQAAKAAPAPRARTRRTTASS
jgi:hypothetical protein